MNITEFSLLLAQKRQELDNMMRRSLPVKVGSLAKAHYQDNIKVRQGFRNSGTTPYQKTQRQLSGSDSAASKYGALLSSSNRLYDSISYSPSDYRVVVANNLKYAPVHNWGGVVQPSVTPQMRKFAWAKNFAEAGGDKKKDTMWKRLALTKKKKLNIRIPQRQFIGESRELNEQIRQKIGEETRNILDKE